MVRGPELARAVALPTGVLTDITGESAMVEALRALVAAPGAEAPRPVAATERKAYSVDQAVEGLFMPRADFERAVEVWRAKRNLVLQGAPGVGKSFVARRLAYALMGHEDPSRVRTVQFHQSYAYEDFVQGFRPDGRGGFALREGVFLQFCRRALGDPG
jgi:AAA domain (dynein-related subfamily)